MTTKLETKIGELMDEYAFSDLRLEISTMLQEISRWTLEQVMPEDMNHSYDKDGNGDIQYNAYVAGWNKCREDMKLKAQSNNEIKDGQIRTNQSWNWTVTGKEVESMKDYVLCGDCSKKDFENRPSIMKSMKEENIALKRELDAIKSQPKLRTIFGYTISFNIKKLSTKS